MYKCVCLHSLSQQIFMMRNDVFDKTKLQARKTSYYFSLTEMLFLETPLSTLCVNPILLNLLVMKTKFL